MIESLRLFKTFFSADDIRRCFVLLFTVVLVGLLEVAGIASILPFLQLAADPQGALDNAVIASIYTRFGFESPGALLYATGWAVIVFLTLSNGLSALSGWQQQRIAWKLSHNISMRLVRTYAKLPYAFFLHRDLADLIKSAIDDGSRLVHGVILAGCSFVSYLVVSLCILLLLTLVQPATALVAVGAFGGLYLLIFLARRKYLARMGQQMLQANLGRYVAFSDFISGIKAVKSDGATAYFLKRFEKPSAEFAELQPRIFVSSALPRYLIETLGFSAIVAVVLYLSTDQKLFTGYLPTLTLFALAGYRLMPAINGVYTSLASMLSSYRTINNIHRDLSAYEGDDIEQISPPAKAMRFEHGIELSGIRFHYDGAPRPVLEDLSLRFDKGQKVAFVGPSGAGKTTLIDIITGMLAPDKGAISVDGKPLTGENLAAWQAAVGYVPQEVFLFNASIAQNIAFGTDDIDPLKLKHVCKIAQIDEHIETQLVQGYDTPIGERGVRLSGGQRQRLGLARALYRDPVVLVLDEATSALDSRTEQRVVDAIYHDLPNVTVVMIAHRISTVRQCDTLFLLDRGRLKASGSYDELLGDSEQFRELARFN